MRPDALTFGIVVRVNVDDAAIRYWLDPLPSASMPNIAAEWLAAGYEGPALTRAASCGKADDTRDVRDAFGDALKELGAWHSSVKSAEIAFVAKCAAAIARNEAQLGEIALEVRRTIEFDTVIYDGLPEPYLELVTMCWVVETDEFERDGGMARLRRAVDDVLAAGRA